MEGQYTFIAATGLPSENVSICSVGVMGTTYVRDETLPSSIEVFVGGTEIIRVPHIRAEDDIGNVLAINLRQKKGTELAFVSFS